MPNNSYLSFADTCSILIDEAVSQFSPKYRLSNKYDGFVERCADIEAAVENVDYIGFECFVSDDLDHSVYLLVNFDKDVGEQEYNLVSWCKELCTDKDWMMAPAEISFDKNLVFRFDGLFEEVENE